MKKVLSLAILIIFLPTVFAVNVPNYLDSLQNRGVRFIVLNQHPTPQEKMAAKILQTKYSFLEVLQERDFADDQNVITMGFPCTNKKVEEYVSCLTWPYNEDEVLIKVADGNLVIAGVNSSLVTAVRVILQDPQQFNYSEFVLKNGKMAKLKSQLNVKCGDKICTPREIQNCPGDCVEKMNCEQYCSFYNFLDYSCREQCKPNEKNVGKKGCADVCCCKVKEPVVPSIELPELFSKDTGLEINSPAVVTKKGKKIVDVAPRKPNLSLLFLKALWKWFKAIF